MSEDGAEIRTAKPRSKWFDPKINIGTILTLCILIGGGLMTLQRLDTSQQSLKKDVAAISENVKETTSALTEIEKFIAGATERARTREQQIEAIARNNDRQDQILQRHDDMIRDLDIRTTKIEAARPR